MKIAVNTRFLLKDKLEGIGWFTYQMISRIVRDHPEHEFHFLFDRKWDSSFIFADNVVPHVLFPPARHPFLWYLWFEYSVPRALKKIKPDLFISPDGYCSLSSNVPTAVVIHDIAVEHFPEHLDRLTAGYMRYFGPLYAKRADKLITVSKYSRKDISRTYNIPQESIDVVYNGAHERYVPLSMADRRSARSRFANGSPYFIYAGSIHPRKNVGRLFQAYDKFRQNTDHEHKLVIAGRKAWNFKDIFNIYENMQYKDDVIFLGHVPAEDLAFAVGGAEAMVYVSVLEGFGIPLLEAMCCDVPVITSSITSMPEVAGDAGILVDPFDVQMIAKAMQRMVDEPGLRDKLVIEAQLQRLHFDWDDSAQKFWDSVTEIV